MYAKIGDILQFCLSEVRRNRQEKETPYCFLELIDDIEDYDSTVEWHDIRSNHPDDTYLTNARDFHRFNVLLPVDNDYRNYVVCEFNEGYENRPKSELFNMPEREENED
jgi:uncharacterized short protein YbdD (DUF466 family)